MKKGFFSEKVVGWYEENKRDLPWRTTHDPYKIWLSEIILQQTRVAQGLPYYNAFVQRYPDVKSLARASEQDILRLWQGLGYYTRARNLRKCAETVVDRFAGNFPRTFEALEQLPGIGQYTAAAIASFAFGEPVAVVDGNVFRVLARVFGADHDIGSPEGRRFFFDLANQLLPAKNAGVYNQAVMEFGALQCVPMNPECPECPLRKHCYAFQRDLQDVLPVKARRAKIRRRYFYYLVATKNRKILMKKRNGRDVWNGLFDFPLHEETRPLSTEKVMKQFGVTQILRPSKLFKHVLTHQIITARFLEVQVKKKSELPSSLISGEMKFYSPEEINRLPKPQLIVRFFDQHH